MAATGNPAVSSCLLPALHNRDTQIGQQISQRGLDALEVTEEVSSHRPPSSSTRQRTGCTPSTDGRDDRAAAVRIVAALGGNALLQRGEKADSDIQEPRQRAVAALAPLARGHDMVITHGNGPQVACWPGKRA